LAALRARSQHIADDLRRAAGSKPFVGIATYGEQGSFFGTSCINRHGNLMCNALLL
jgi:hypothetical protein